MLSRLDALNYQMQKRNVMCNLNRSKEVWFVSFNRIKIRDKIIIRLLMILKTSFQLSNARKSTNLKDALCNNNNLIICQCMKSKIRTMSSFSFAHFLTRCTDSSQPVCHIFYNIINLVQPCCQLPHVQFQCGNRTLDLLSTLVKLTTLGTLKECS